MPDCRAARQSSTAAATRYLQAAAAGAGGRDSPPAALESLAFGSSASRRQVVGPAGVGGRAAGSCAQLARRCCSWAGTARVPSRSESAPASPGAGGPAGQQTLKHPPRHVVHLSPWLKVCGSASAASWHPRARAPPGRDLPSPLLPSKRHQGVPPALREAPYLQPEPPPRGAGRPGTRLGLSASW